MHFLSYLSLPLLSLLLTPTTANTPLPHSLVQQSLSSPSSPGLLLALSSRPLFHFSQSRDNPPCYPSTALSPTTNLTHGVPPSKWPNASLGCDLPGTPKGTEGNPFPTYYTVTQCSEDEVRVVYNLYFQKDGFSNVVIAKGHVHDWERVIVIWKRKKTTSTDEWIRDRLMLGMHSGYTSYSWGNVQNTFDGGIHDVDGDEEWKVQGGRNKDHPKVYVGWAKHAMFQDRNTGFNDKVSQGCQREFRGADWWWWPRSPLAISTDNGITGLSWREEEARGGLVHAGGETEIGKMMSSPTIVWGSANSGPWRVEARVCGEKEGGYVKC